MIDGAHCHTRPAWVLVQEEQDVGEKTRRIGRDAIQIEAGDVSTFDHGAASQGSEALEGFGIIVELLPGQCGGLGRRPIEATVQPQLLQLLWWTTWLCAFLLNSLWYRV